MGKLASQVCKAFAFYSTKFPSKSVFGMGLEERGGEKIEIKRGKNDGVSIYLHLYLAAFLTWNARRGGLPEFSEVALPL